MANASNKVSVLLVVEIGDMTEKTFQKALADVRGYAAARFETESGRLVGHSERPAYLPKERKTKG
jgi:hypothetical protein